MRILIIRLGAIGDVIMTTPILKAIKDKYPECDLTYVVGEWSAGVLKNNPHVDNLKIIDEKIFLKKDFHELRLLMSELRESDFDIGIALDKSWMFNVFLFLCNIKKIYGFSREYHIINKIISTKSIKFTGEKKEYQYYRDILYAITRKVYNHDDVKLYPTEDEKAKVDRIIKNLHFLKGGSRKFFGMAPGGAANPGQKALQKRWPRKYYREVTDFITKANKGSVAIIGGPKDKAYNNVFNNLPLVYNLTDMFNIRESYYFIKTYCHTFITHDSGPMHLASAAKVKKLITIFGPTPHKRFAPKKAIVISSTKCPPSYNLNGTFSKSPNCMKYIKPEEVKKYLKWN